MSYPPPDHRSIASERQTTSLRVPKESRESDGAWPSQTMRRHLTNAVSTPAALCTRGTHGGQENSYLFSQSFALLIPGSRIVESNLANGWRILTWPRPGQPPPAAPAGASRLPHVRQTPG